jgi:hypothetical protein
MRGYNFGGLKATASQTGASLHTHEGHGATLRAVRSRFRTYANPGEGARDYVSTLRERYPEAIRAAESGNVEGFVEGLVQRRYFTGSAHDYRVALRSLSRERLRADQRFGIDQSVLPGILDHGSERWLPSPGAHHPNRLAVDAPDWAVEGTSRALWRAIWAKRA